MRVTWIGRSSICVGVLRVPGQDYDFPTGIAQKLKAQGMVKLADGDVAPVTPVAPVPEPEPTPEPVTRSSSRGSRRSRMTSTETED